MDSATLSTWVSGELVTAALMNTHVRDNLLAIDTMFGIACAPATGRVPVGDATDFATHAHLFVSAASLLVRHEVGGMEFDASAITTGGLVKGASAGTMGILGVGTNGQFLKVCTCDLAWGSSAIQSTVLTQTRTGGCCGTQCITGAGFDPIVAHMFTESTTVNDSASIGFMGGCGNESMLRHCISNDVWILDVTRLAFVSNAAGNGHMIASAAFVTDGVQLTWATCGVCEPNVSFDILMIG